MNSEASSPLLVFTKRNEKRRKEEINTIVNKKITGWITVLKISNFWSGDTKSIKMPSGKSDTRKRYKNGRYFLWERIYINTTNTVPILPISNISIISKLT